MLPARVLDSLRTCFARDWLRLLALFVIYSVTGVFGHQFSYGHPGTTLIWLPSGLALGALLILGYRIWPVILGASIVVHGVVLGPGPAVPLLAAGHTLESLLAAYLVNRFADGRHALQNPRNTFRFAGVALLAATASGATVNALVLVMTGTAAPTDYGVVWLALSLGSLGGIVLLAPLVVLHSQGAPHWRLARTVEVCGMLVAVVLTGLIAFFRFPVEFRVFPTELLVMPVLLWPAFRLGQRASAAALLVLSVMAITGTLGGYGPFVRATPFESLAIVQLFLTAAAVMTTSLAALSTDYEVAEAQLRELAVTDPLTGLANYRRLLDVIGLEIARANRHNRKFAIVFFDMDDLKKINDELGHLIGSRAVCRFAETLQVAMRTTDTAARYGGDEFVAVLADTDQEGAEMVVRRTHERLLEDPDKPRLSVSAGIAVYPGDGGTPTTLLSAADRALYVEKAAKSAARRRGVVGVAEWNSAS